MKTSEALLPGELQDFITLKIMNSEYNKKAVMLRDICFKTITMLLDKINMLFT